MYIDAALGDVGKVVSRIEVSSSWDSPHCRVKLLVQREDGGAGLEESNIEPELEERQTPFAMRREATRELLARGINYLIFSPGEYAGRDLYEGQAEWGIKLAGEESGKWLFRIEPYRKKPGR